MMKRWTLSKKLRISTSCATLFLLWVYFFFITPDAIRGYQEFLTLLLFHAPIFVISRWVLAPRVFRREPFQLRKLLQLYTITYVLWCLGLIVYSFCSGALRFEGIESFYISNFLEVTITFLCPSILGLAFYLLYWGRLKWEEHQKDKGKVREQEQELRTLLFKFGQQRLVPHFLFNTLNTIEVLNRINHERAVPAFAQLIKVSQFYVNMQDRLSIPLADELEQLQSKLEIYAIRKNKPLFVEQHIEPELCLQTPVLAMILVNLMENVCQYGIITDPTKPAQLNLGPWMDKGICIFVRNHIAGAPLQEVVQGHGQLVHLEKSLALLHPQNRIEIRNDGDIFTVNVHLHPDGLVYTHAIHVDKSS